MRNHLHNCHAIEMRLHMHKCEVTGCKRTFVYKSQASYHYKMVHQDGEKRICDFCSKVFKTKHSLDEHRKMHTRRPEDRYQCEICHHYLSDIRVFRRHVKNHETEKLENICHYCGKKSPNLRALKGHIRMVHEIVKKYKCKYCPKFFKTPRYLQDHEASIHTLEDIYSCDFCTRKL